MHRKLVYALFELESFLDLKELDKRLKAEKIDFKYIRIKRGYHEISKRWGKIA
jgi:hypothetical protein